MIAQILQREQKAAGESRWWRGDTGGVAFRNDAVGAPTPLLRARAVLENDGNAHAKVGETRLGSIRESGERLRSWTLA
jgi:hypothetical protein